MTDLVETDVSNGGAIARGDSGGSDVVLILANAIADPNVPVEKMQFVVDLYKEERSDARKNQFFAALAKAQSEFKQAEQYKPTYNKTKYAPLGEIARAVRDPLFKNGLSFNFGLVEDGNVLTLSCTLMHEGGHTVSVSMSGAPDTSGSKNMIQARKSTVTYLRRATLEMVTGVTVDDSDDDDGQGGAPTTGGGYNQRKQYVGDYQQCQQQAQAQQAQPQNGGNVYDDKKFETMLPKWADKIKSGESTVERLFAFLKSKGYQLTESQVNKIKSIEV